MDEIQVMTVIQLKSAGDALVKKMVDAVYKLPLKIFFLYVQCNIKMLYLAVDSYLMIYDVLKSVLTSKPIFREVEKPEDTVKQDEIIRGVQKLRRSLVINLHQYYRLKFKADNREAIRRLDVLRSSMKGSNEKFQEALNSVNEINATIREERKNLEKVDELQYDKIIDGIKDCCEEKRRENEDNQVSNLSAQRKVLGMEVCYRYLSDIRKHIASRRKNGVSKSRLNATNMKLEHILRVSSNLVDGLNKLNHQVSNLAEVSGRMADMQYELGAGRKLLSEVEADRNEMKRKLATLERLIKEEEEYLDDFSNESEFENEVPVSS